MNPRSAGMAFGGDGDHPPQTVGAGQGRMGGHHDLQIGDDLGREGHHFARVEADMQRHIFRAGRQPAFAGMMQLRPEMNPLAVIIDELDGGAGRHARQKLLFVDHMGFGKKDRGFALVHRFGAQIKRCQHLVKGQIHQMMVPRHIHMAVIIDPGAFDPPDGRHKGCKKQSG